jgi:hypothetical protein
VRAVSVDQVWVEASTEPWDPLQGEAAGPFELFKAQRDRVKWQGQRRGLRLRPDNGLSECVLPYQVTTGP